jgi:hypothetical protein
MPSQLVSAHRAQLVHGYVGNLVQRLRAQNLLKGLSLREELRITASQPSGTVEMSVGSTVEKWVVNG